MRPSRTSRVRPAAAGTTEGSKGRPAAATRAGSAAARPRAAPAATRSRKSPTGVASRPRSRKTMKWLPSSISSSLCGTSRWCSRAAPAGTSGSCLPWTMKHRHLEPLQDAAQRPLVGVVEVARVGQVEGKSVEAAEVGRRLVQRPEGGQLDGVDRVVERIVAQQLQLLDADGRQQGHERTRPGASAASSSATPPPMLKPTTSTSSTASRSRSSSA